MWLVILMKVNAYMPLTIGNVEDDGSADEQRNDLHRVADRFELSGHRRAESHVANDDGRERIDNTVGNGAVQSTISMRTQESGWTKGLRSKDADEDQNRLRVYEPQLNLTLVERLVLDTHVVTRHALDGDETLALVEEVCV